MQEGQLAKEQYTLKTLTRCLLTTGAGLMIHDDSLVVLICLQLDLVER